MSDDWRAMHAYQRTDRKMTSEEWDLIRAAMWIEPWLRESKWLLRGIVPSECRRAFFDYCTRYREAACGKG